MGIFGKTEPHKPAEPPAKPAASVPAPAQPAAGKSSGTACVIGAKTLVKGEIGGSEYLARVHGTVGGAVPPIDIQAEKRLHDLVLELIGRKLVSSAHDCSEGGLAVSVAESLVAAHGKGKSLGAVLALPAGIRADRWLFGEDQSRMVVTASAANLGTIRELAGARRVPVHQAGEVTGDGNFVAGTLWKIGVPELAETHSGALERLIAT